MKTSILYSDQDGVLTDFYAGAEKVLGHPWNKHGVNAVDRGRILNQHEGFWEHLPPMKDFHLYWSFIDKFSPHILTAVPAWDHDYQEVYDGKWAWVRKNLPGFPQSRFHVVTRDQKASYARSSSGPNLLIDDFDRNIAEFQAAGGIGILYHGAKTTIIKLKELGYH